MIQLIIALIILLTIIKKVFSVVIKNNFQTNGIESK